MESLLKTVNKLLGPDAAAVIIIIVIVFFIGGSIVGIIGYIKKGMKK